MKNAATILLLLLPLVFGCAKAKDEPKPQDPSQEVAAEFGAYQTRLVSMLDNGWVVSRDSDGSVAHAGDSLIWSGVALGTLDCDAGQPIEDALLAMLQETGGKMYRHPTLKDEVSLDGAIGLYFGIARRVSRCPSSLEKWSVAVGLNAAFGDDPMNANGEKLPKDWDVLRDLLMVKLAQAPAPDQSRAGSLQTEVAVWAAGVNAKHASCYRVNLGWLTLQTLEELGADTSRGRNEFCVAVRGMDIPLVRSYCGDTAAIPDYVASFKPDEWEFRHQRCTGWETPDGAPYKTPALDLLLAIREGYLL